MSRYNRVPESFWQHATDWDDRVRILAMYLLTCKHRTGEGLYQIPQAYIAADLGWPASTVKRQMGNLTSTDYVKYDAKAEVVLLPEALELQTPTSPTQVTGAIRRLKALPRTPLLMDFYFHANAHSNALANEMRIAWPGVFECNNGSHSDGLRARSAEDALAHAHSPTATQRGAVES